MQTMQTCQTSEVIINTTCMQPTFSKNGCLDEMLLLPRRTPGETNKTY